MGKITLVWPNRANYSKLTGEQLERIAFVVWPAWVKVKADGNLYPVQKKNDLYEVHESVTLTPGMFNALVQFYTEYVLGPGQGSLMIVGEVESLDEAGYEIGIQRHVCDECLSKWEIPLPEWTKGVLEVKNEFTGWIFNVWNLMRDIEGRTLN